MTGLPRPWDAVVLAGGRGTRLGGVRKPALEVGGRSLLEAALDATAGARRTVVVGPPDLCVPAGTLHTLEDPPFGGPVAGVAAGLARLGPADGWVLLLAADLPRAERVVATLAAADDDLSAIDGRCLRDPGGRWQWLAGVYRRTALDAALAALPAVRDVSLRRLLGSLRLHPVPGGPAVTADVDTAADLVAARAGEQNLADSEEPPARVEGAAMSQDLPPIQEWVRRTCAELGIDPELVDLRALLDMSRDVAHHVDRPAAPVTAYLVGLAVGSRTSASPETAREVIDRASQLARRWEKETQG